jgi:hypothetical protein
MIKITRSIDDFARTSRQRYPQSSLSSQFVHQSLLKNAARRSSYSNVSLTTIPKCRVKETTHSSAKVFSESINDKTNLPSNLLLQSESSLQNRNSSTNLQLSLYWNEKSLKSRSRHYLSHNAAIMDSDHQSNLSLNKSPLSMNTNQSSISNNPIQSAYIIDQYPYANKNTVSLYSCVSEIGDNQPTESISSNEDGVKRSLLQYKESRSMEFIGYLENDDG